MGQHSSQLSHTSQGPITGFFPPRGTWEQPEVLTELEGMVCISGKTTLEFGFLAEWSSMRVGIVDEEEKLQYAGL